MNGNSRNGGRGNNRRPQRETITQEEFDKGLESGAIKLTDKGPTGKGPLPVEEQAERLLEGKEGKPVPVAVGWYTKDGRHFNVKGEDGHNRLATKVVEPLTDQSKLEDVSKDYVDIVRSSPSFQEKLAQLQAMFDRQREDSWQRSAISPPESVMPTTDMDKSRENVRAYFGDFEARLTALHMNGGYCKEVDSTTATFDTRMDVRRDLIQQDPKNAEMDTALVNQSRHWLNTQNKFLEHGVDFADCTFTGPDGKPLAKLSPDATKEEYQRYTDSIVYGLDHGLIKGCTGPDGKAIEGLPVRDEYMDNIGYYDEHAKEINDFRCKVEAETAARLEDKAKNCDDPQGHPEIAGCKITAVTNEQYWKDASENASATLGDYQARAAAYQADKNPMLEQLKSMGCDVDYVPPAPQANQRDAAATIAQAQLTSQNVPEVDKTPEAEQVTK